MSWQLAAATASTKPLHFVKWQYQIAMDRNVAFTIFVFFPFSDTNQDALQDQDKQQLPTTLKTINRYQEKSKLHLRINPSEFQENNQYSDQNISYPQTDEQYLMTR